MIKRVMLGAALGYFGKKLYDEGKLDPFLMKAKSKLEEFSDRKGSTVPPEATDRGEGQPDLAF